MASFYSRPAIVAICTIIILIMAGESEGRELRPSEHGLEYQDSPPPGKKSPEMVTFFGGGSEGSDSRPSSSSSDVALPKAMNSNDTSWWSNGGIRDGRGGGSGGEGDHVRHVLVLASVVCGITGVVLLVASGFIFLFRFKKQKSSSPSSTSPPLHPPPSLCLNNTK